MSLLSGIRVKHGDAKGVLGIYYSEKSKHFKENVLNVVLYIIMAKTIT